MAVGNFFGGQFFGGGFFGSVDVAVKTGTGGIDPKRRIVKPTGLLHLHNKRGKLPEKIEDRIEDSARENAEISAKLSAKLYQDFRDETKALDRPPVVEMSLSEIDAEIGLLLRKKLRTQEDEILILLLMTAAAA